MRIWSKIDQFINMANAEEEDVLKVSHFDRTAILLEDIMTVGTRIRAYPDLKRRIFPMNKSISLGILVGGILLIPFGISVSQSVSSDISRFFTGSPTEKAIWMLSGGVAATIIGLLGVSRGSTQH